MIPIIKNLQQLLETEISFGVHSLARGASSPVAPSGSSKQAALDAYYQEIRECVACPLGQTRTHFVFGAGNPEAKLMFVGEAPGFEEDQKGLPFVGAAGQLLTKIISAMGLSRDQVYIANCLKCRPTQNRNPLPEEIVLCKPILMRQIEIIQPCVICALGKFAAQTLLETTEPISRLRGRFFDWQGIQLISTFHPAYLLRNPADKRLVWEDVQKIMKFIETAG